MGARVSLRTRVLAVSAMIAVALPLTRSNAASGSIAKKRREAAKLSAQIESLGVRIAQLNEDYLSAEQRLARLRTQSARSSVTRDAVVARLERIRVQLREQALYEFTHPAGGAGLDALEGSSDFGDFERRLVIEHQQSGRKGRLGRSTSGRSGRSGSVVGADRRRSPPRRRDIGAFGPAASRGRFARLFRADAVRVGSVRTKPPALLAQPVRRDEASVRVGNQAGDLVFFGHPIHHVGMYVGNGKMVEASRRGKPVKIGSIFRRDMVGVGRV